MPMKRLFFALLAIMALSCSKFDDSEIWDKLNNHESRIAELEMLCKEMNAEIIKLQTLVTALESNDYIVTASPLVTGDGYTFVFKSGKSVVIYNGKDGKDGKDGENGKDGINGNTPQIGVKKDTDGFYYWTVNGEWLIVDGNKVRASANDGTNGTTPRFKIEDDYWYISYDNGATWEILGKVVGDDGLNGEDGDSIIKYITVEDGYVKFVLNDENNTVLKLPVVKEIKAITIDVVEEGTIHEYISTKEAEGVERLVCAGPLNEQDLNFIYSFFLSAVEIDLSNCTYSDYNCSYPTSQSPLVSNPYANRALEVLKLPSNLVDFTSFYPNLKVVECQTTKGNYRDSEYLFRIPNSLYYQYSINGAKSQGVSLKLKKIELAHGIDGIYGEMKNTYSEKTDISRSYYASCDTLCIPSTVSTIANTCFMVDNSESGAVTYEYADVIVCKAAVPPTLNYPDSEKKTTGKFCTAYYTMPTNRIYTSRINNPLYVPAGSVEAYKVAPGWSQFNNIFPIED